MKFAIGEKLWVIKETSNAFHRVKLEKEIDGEIWWRYNKAVRDYEVHLLVIVGVIEKKLHGDLEAIKSAGSDYMTHDEYLVQNITQPKMFFIDELDLEQGLLKGADVLTDISQVLYSSFFLTKEAAEEAVALKKDSERDV